jgi:hypothetical protein
LFQLFLLRWLYCSTQLLLIIRSDRLLPIVCSIVVHWSDAPFRGHLAPAAPDVPIARLLCCCAAPSRPVVVLVVLSFQHYCYADVEAAWLPGCQVAVLCCCVAPWLLQLLAGVARQVPVVLVALLCLPGCQVEPAVSL